MTNREYLDYLAHEAPDQLTAWFESEYVDPTEYIILAQAYKVERDGLRERLRKLLEDDLR